MYYMANKRIYNPKTGKYMQIRQRTTSKGKKGQIMSGYSSKTSGAINKNFSRAIRRLSTR